MRARDRHPIVTTVINRRTNGRWVPANELLRRDERLTTMCSPCGGCGCPLVSLVRHPVSPETPPKERTCAFPQNFVSLSYLSPLDNIPVNCRHPAWHGLASPTRPQ